MRALELGLKPVVVINKIDKPARRIAGRVEDELSDLFCGASYLMIVSCIINYYAVGRDGKAWREISY